MGDSRRIGYRLHLVCWGLFVLVFMFFVPTTVRADINGYLEYSYFKTDSTSTDKGPFSLTAKNNSSSFLQRYFIVLDRMLYPNLRFTAGGNFEWQNTDSEVEALNLSTKTTSTDSKIFPYASLLLSNGFTSEGIGYRRRQETTKSTGVPSVTTIIDSYNGLFGLKPEGLPTLDVFINRIDSYDADRISQNTTTESVVVSSRYSLFKNLDLSYQNFYNDQQDKLQNVEIQSMNQTGRISYNGQFLKDRATVYSSYNISSQNNKVIAGGSGEILNQLFPDHGLFKITEFPDTVELGSLDQYDQLITGTAAINIGKPPFGTIDTKPRNLGLQFINPTAINVIRVLVNQNLGIQNIFTNYAWSVYTSSDEGRTWVLLQKLGPENISFGFFTGAGGSSSYGFELHFPTVTATFIKVVTTPLVFLGPAPPGIDLNTILVTKLDPFFRGAVQGGSERTSHTLAGHLDMSAKVRLFERPFVYYDLNYTYNHASTDLTSATSYSVTNGLSLAHKFNETWATFARVSREDSSDQSGSRSLNIYSASVTATPIPTLMSSLLFSGRNETVQGQTTSTYSLFLNNNAELYRGINVLLNGGINRTIAPTDRITDDLLYQIGANLVPHRTVNFNFNVNGRKSFLSGGGLPDDTTYKQDSQFNLTVQPLDSLYVFGSLTVSAETSKKTSTTWNFGGTYSPLRQGNLLLSVSYNQSQTDTSLKETSLTPSLRWYIRSSSYLDIAYSIIKNSSIVNETDTNTFSTTLRLTF